MKLFPYIFGLTFVFNALYLLAFSQQAFGQSCDLIISTPLLSLSELKSQIQSTQDSNANGILDLCSQGNTAVRRSATDPDQITIEGSNLVIPRLHWRNLSTSGIVKVEDLTGDDPLDIDSKGMIHFKDIEVTIERVDFITVGDWDPALTYEGESALSLKQVEIRTSGDWASAVASYGTIASDDQLLIIEGSLIETVSSFGSIPVSVRSTSAHSRVLIDNSTLRTISLSGSAAYIQGVVGEIRSSRFFGNTLISNSSLSRITASKIYGYLSINASEITNKISNLTVFANPLGGGSLELFGSIIPEIDGLNIRLENTGTSEAALVLAHGSLLDELRNFAIFIGDRRALSKGILVESESDYFHPSFIQSIDSGSISVRNSADCLSYDDLSIGSLNDVTCNSASLREW